VRLTNGTGRTYERRAFTLIEVIVSMVILGVIAVALTKMLQSQSRFYDEQTHKEQARSVARNAMNVLLSELRMVQDQGGVTSASSDGKTLEVIVPYQFGLYCGVNGTAITVSMLPMDSAVVAMATYGGFAWRDSTTGSYNVVTPSDLLAQAPVTSTSPATCTGNGGSDAQIKSVSVSGRSGQILDLQPLTLGITVGAPVFLWQKITYAFKASTTFPGAVALWRKVGTDDEELLAPFDTSARFNYYTSGSDAVSATVPAVGDIRGVQLVLNALSPNPVAGGSQAAANVVTSVFFKNMKAY
jgi:prepilin-type N-terminal cleavage/methylation domain-containing protein